MKAFIAGALGKVRVVLFLLALLLAAGTTAYVSIPKEADPSVKIPIIYISVHQQGIAPGDAERMIVKPLEQELTGIEGLDEMRATAYQGGANVVLEFGAGFDADQALRTVRERVDTAQPDLPADAEEPSVNEVDLSLFPVLNVTLSGQVGERQLLESARLAQDRLEGINDVLEAELVGDRDEVVHVVIDPEKVESYGLSAGRVAQIYRKFNQVVAAGQLTAGQGNFPVQVPGLIDNVRDVLDMPIKTSGDRVVRASDLAKVQSGFEDRQSYARLNGQGALNLEVVKRSGANVIDTVAQVKTAMSRLQSELPAGVNVTYSQNQAQTMKDLLGELENNVIASVVLVLIVVLAVLGWRISAMVAISIPGSFLTGILVVWALGYSLNIVVLFALILAVGILIDGTIVVAEYADRKMTEGLDRAAAFTRSAQLMAWPIISATATTLAAFFPLLFWPGVPGQFMKYLPITLIATLSAAAFMALVFVPALGKVLGRPSGGNDDQAQALAADGGDLTVVRGITGLYIRFLRRCMCHAGTTVLIAFLVLFGVYALYGAYNHGTKFFPDVEPDNAIVVVKARGNLSAQEKDTLVRQVEDRIFGMTGIETVYTRSGKFGQQSGNLPEDAIGKLTLGLTDWQTRPPAETILQRIRKKTDDLAGIAVTARKQQQGPGAAKPINVRVRGDAMAQLLAAAGRIRTHMASMDGLQDIEDNRPLPGIEYELAVDRAAAQRYGVDLNEVGKMVQMVTGGATLASFRPGDTTEEVDIKARFPTADQHLSQLDDLRIVTQQGRVPLSHFLTRKAEPEVANIYRVGGTRYFEVKAATAPGVQANAKIAELRTWLKSQDFEGVRWAFAGQQEQQQESKRFLMKAFAVAIGIMLLILLTQFNSFYHVLVVLTAVILSTGGVLVGLLVAGRPLTIVMTGTGIIALAGIVVNNNIVFIDTFNRLRANEATRFDAILRAGAQRFRPVLLTAGTTMAGLLPLTLMWTIDFTGRSFSVGAPSTQFFTDLALAIFAGLGFASALTLVVTPAMMVLEANLAAWRQRRRQGATAGAP